MTIQEYCDLYLAMWKKGITHQELKRSLNDFKKNHVSAMIKILSPIQDDDILWFKTILKADAKKKFALFIFYELKVPLPKELYESMLRAAIYEINPSENKFFIIPCIKASGCRRVNETLLEYVEKGNNFEKAGAVNALYWAIPQVKYRGRPPTYSKEYATQASIKELEEFRDVWMKRKRLLLEEFINNTDVSVRRSIIPHLELIDPFSYPEDIRPLVDEAIKIARNHEDEYIRQRVEIQLYKRGGTTTPMTLMALPDRKKINPDQRD